MSKELIKITTNDEGKQLVSARELHEGLGLNKTNWSRWSKTNIKENEFFTENIDWIGFSRNDENLLGGRPTEDFVITLEFAKHLAMMARTEKSHEYRNYFLECEKKLKQLDIPSYMIDDPIARAKKWIEEQKQTQALAEKVEELQPKADYTDNVLASDELLTSTQIAKEFGMSAFRFNQLMNELGVIYKQGKIWVLYSKYANEGYTKYVTHLVSGTGSVTYTKWTQKGRKFIYNILAENGIYPVC